jgi:3-phenylpropionate/trans-cinnamate dioxygenase ferredoxin subunit
VGDTFYRIGRVDALAENGAISHIVNGQPIAVAACDGKLAAFLDICPHAGAQLSGGRVRRGRIFCPLHGAPFSLDTGLCMAPQPYAPLRMLPVRVVDEWIEVAVPDEAAMGISEDVE